MAEQNPHEIFTLVSKLESAKSTGKKVGKKGYSCKKSSFPVAGSDIVVDSWRFQDWDYKQPDLPTYARGLFTAKNRKAQHEIVIRGYDKFFNVGEVSSTEWPNIENSTTGPYELSVKENGCIIFISGLEDGSLLVCSKHSTGARSDVAQSHAVVGERWVEKHLQTARRTRDDLARELRHLNVTVVGELCDDEFEEHVLEYQPHMAGLYLHGINYNQSGFQTWSGAEVHAFADAWGFKKAEYIMMQTIDEVKPFLDKCAQTGSFDGRDTEGFVIRCKRRERGGDYVDWFFKYKFEEPYLMYRQWREATKAVIASKPPKFKKHKQITDEYLLYARRQLAKDPRLGKMYNQNHGIIAMRDGFLAEKGKKGSEIIAEERRENGDVQEDAVTRNMVLVPIATIGCGKTTVATALVKLFDWGHIQNDNIQGKGRPQRFVLALTNELSSRPAVIADRNNSSRRERVQIIEDIGKVVPDATFVALHWVHEPKTNANLDTIRKVTRRRVLERGDNHQTIQADTKDEKEIVGIMEGFLHRFEGMDKHKPGDSDFDEVVDLDVRDSSLDNLDKVVNHLYNAYPRLFPQDMPTYQDMQDAIDFAMSGTVSLKHEINSRPDKRPAANSTYQQSRMQKQQQSPSPIPQNLTPDQSIARLEYFSVALSSTVITSLLSEMFNPKTTTLPPEQSRFYTTLKQSRRLQPEFHVTLCHRSQSSSDAWKFYTQAYLAALAKPSAKNDKALNPSLGVARIRLEKLVWDERVMAFLVRIMPREDGGGVWPVGNENPHVTVGTATTDVKPKEANDLLDRWAAGGGDVELTGAKIWERDVPGVKVLEGSVKAVAQRGR